ncbi:MAG: hypothetical protein M0Q90_05305 [Bacteroidales bacterium]|nr:hypothetical protein [Bacteroidales bacterium]
MNFKSNSMYNPKIHHRRSIRLKGYDYAQQGLYYITICVQNRLCLFGEIFNGEMLLNDAGKMIEKWYYELENKYPDKKCHEMVVMPNHFHFIIENSHGPDAHIAMQTDDRVATQDAHVWTSQRGRSENDNHPDNDGRPDYGINNQKHNVTVGNAMG